MCETAVEYAPSYQIWWTVSLKKKSVCEMFMSVCTFYCRKPVRMKGKV